LREALYCLRCGACLNVCPVYRQIGGHAYGHTYPGPIGILLTAMLNGPGAVKDLAHASSLCGACADACPVRIDIPRMLIELRREVDEKRIAPWTERSVFKAFGWLPSGRARRRRRSGESSPSAGRRRSSASAASSSRSAASSTACRRSPRRRPSSRESPATAGRAGSWAGTPPKSAVTSCPRSLPSGSRPSRCRPGRSRAGPSRTADIELTLTRGVHGPKEVHAIFVEAPAGG